MNTNPKYNPEDLEDLLLHKSFDELHESEQEFVLQHIDSISEYKELRNTLLSIKEYSQNNEQIVAEPKVKERLLELFEKGNRKPFAWFSLNSIGAFLFPTETPIFRKPAFQIATFAVLALFVVNIGNIITPKINDNLAQNTKVTIEKDNIPSDKSNESTIEKESITETEKTTQQTDLKEFRKQKNKAEVTEGLLKYKDLETDKSKFKDQNENLENSKGYFETTAENTSSFNKREENSLTEMEEEDVEEITVNKRTTKSLNEIATTQGTPVTKIETVTISGNDAYSDLDYSKNINSQSLDNEDELIDILFVTM